MKRLLKILVLLFVLLGAVGPLPAQVPPPAPIYQPLSGDQLDQLLGPIALYPDPLIAEILPAATFPEQIVLADRYVNGGGDPGQLDQQPWDPSVQGLARYPELLKWLDDNLGWTTELGQAFINQPQDVMDSIQRLRQSAYNFGNLQSTPQQQVTDEDGYIQIVPVDPDTLYLPVYQPDVVYDQSANGTPFVTFGGGWAAGPWLNCDFDWGNHHVIVWNHDHPRPPNWWHQPVHDRNPEFAAVWHGGDHSRTMGPDHDGDRGWNTPDRQPAATDHHQVVTVIGRSGGPAPGRTPMPAAHQQAPAYHAAPVIERPQPAAPARHEEPASTGAFVGSQNSHDTQNYSDRGRASLQTPASHFVPTSRPAASGGGGGSHASGGSHTSGGSSNKR